jgi:hypothetical protein
VTICTSSCCILQLYTYGFAKSLAGFFYHPGFKRSSKASSILLRRNTCKENGRLKQRKPSADSYYVSSGSVSSSSSLQQAKKKSKTTTATTKYCSKNDEGNVFEAVPSAVHAKWQPHGSFLGKLYALLEDAEVGGNHQAIISWTEDGNGFRVHKRNAFCEKMTNFNFTKQTKFTSFTRLVINE